MFNLTKLREKIDNKVILITGGSGTWGRGLTKLLLEELNPKEIRIFSRNEYNQVRMQRKFNDERIKYIIGDVRDNDALNNSIKNVDIVYHLSCLKHVPICEAQPDEAIKTNIQGSINVSECAILNNVKYVVDVSSDKSVNPLNMYGMTKQVGERYMMNKHGKSNTNFCCLRAGNVIGTDGSVIPYWIKELTKENGVPNIKLTEESMTRFWIPLKNILYYLIESLFNPGCIIIPEMKSCRMDTLLNVLLKLYPVEKVNAEKIPIRPGEKLHEIIISKEERYRTWHNTKVEEFDRYIIYSVDSAIDYHIQSEELSSEFSIEKDFEKLCSMIKKGIEDIKEIEL